MRNEREIWKDIEGFEGYYQISNHGRVKSLARAWSNKCLKDKLLKIGFNKKGYPHIRLGCGIDKTTEVIHRLVAETFIPNPSNYPQVNHIDGNKLNNHVHNLEWVTGYQNIRHAWDVGLKKKTDHPRGEAIHCSKLTEEDVLKIKTLKRDYPMIPNAAIAKAFKINNATCGNILNNRLWTHVKLTEPA